MDGSFYRTEDNVLYGIDGWVNGNFMDNLWSEYVEYEGVEYNFWTVLAIFFPAVTGIMAGILYILYTVQSDNIYKNIH